MNYHNIYINLIEKAIDREDHDGYFERHHITPRSMGGTDAEINIVKLTSREHFIAHWLLYKTHKNRQMAQAFFIIAMNSCNPYRYKTPSFKYAKKAKKDKNIKEYPLNISATTVDEYVKNKLGIELKFFARKIKYSSSWLMEAWQKDWQRPTVEALVLKYHIDEFKSR